MANVPVTLSQNSPQILENFDNKSSDKLGLYPEDNKERS